jgi:microsomal dipeptidase-like Zn-dependent dipeptidase
MHQDSIAEGCHLFSQFLYCDREQNNQTPNSGVNAPQQQGQATMKKLPANTSSALSNQPLRLLGRATACLWLAFTFSLSANRSLAQAPPTFNQIQFVITTGNDDLRHDSSATASLLAPNGATLQVVTLKDQHDNRSWGNNATQTVTASLNPPRSLAEVGQIVIALQTHNGFGESDDNWNVNNIAVTLSNNGAGQTQLAGGSGAPLQRLTKNQSLTLTPHHNSPPQQAGPPPASSPPGTFNQITFVIGTGNDDLRGDSSATATLLSPNGATLQVITLKDQHDNHSWANGTSHTIPTPLNPPRSLAEIGQIVIGLQTHNGFGESDDNWNVDNVVVTLSNNGAGQTQLAGGSGAPLQRLTKTQTLTLRPLRRGPPGTYNQIAFVIGTGNDDLRSDSSATATLLSPNGATLQVITLKDQHNNQSWANNSTITIPAVALDTPRTAAEIGHIAITLQTHNGFGESDDNWNVQGVIVSLANSGEAQIPLMSALGNPLQRLTTSLPTLVLDNPNSIPNVLGPQPGTGRLRGFVDLHTHPLANLGFGGKLLYGGVDVGSMLPADPDCNRNVRALCMQQALGHDGSTHGGAGVNLDPFGGHFGLDCGDTIREQVIHGLQKKLQLDHDVDGDAHGAPDFTQWPTWWDVTHQKMWVDWIRRTYLGGLRVMVLLATSNKTLGDMTAGPGDFPTDDKSSADLQLTEATAFVSRHSDFMEIARSPSDLERIVRANKLAIVLGIEVDNIGDFNKANPLTETQITAEIDRLFQQGVRYIFPIHVLDNPFGGTAAYEDLFNYSTFREAGHWWSLECADSSIGYSFKPVGDAALFFAKLFKLEAGFAFSSPPAYSACPSGQRNTLGLTPNGLIAIKQMMRHGMLIDIDHMSELAQSGAIALAANIGSGYPLNSGHSGLRGNNGTERNMTSNQYAAIARLHGMAGIGSVDLDAYQWVQMYQKVLQAMGPGAVAGFGTDTDGLQPGMPPRRGSSVRYDESFPRSRLGTREWDYNTDGVAHYGMLPDFLADARTAPGGKDLVDANLMLGADYFLQTWKKCESESSHVR